MAANINKIMIRSQKRGNTSTAPSGGSNQQRPRLLAHPNNITSSNQKRQTHHSAFSSSKPRAPQPFSSAPTQPAVALRYTPSKPDYPFGPPGGRPSEQTWDGAWVAPPAASHHTAAPVWPGPQLTMPWSGTPHGFPGPQNPSYSQPGPQNPSYSHPGSQNPSYSQPFNLHQPGFMPQPAPSYSSSIGPLHGQPAWGQPSYPGPSSGPMPGPMPGASAGPMPGPMPSSSSRPSSGPMPGPSSGPAAWANSTYSPWSHAEPAQDASSIEPDKTASNFINKTQVPKKEAMGNKDTKQTKTEFKIKTKSSKKETENSLHFLAASIEGMQHWSQYKNKTALMFEIIAILNSAITTDPRTVAKDFVLKDESRTVQAVFYEIDRQLPRLVRGQSYRCVGNLVAKSGKFRCVSIRSATEDEKHVHKVNIKAADKHMRTMVVKFSEA